ncbi:MAG: alpha/beta hydrolase [Gammaproteobacteria bacterium]|nr:alpha/beta hydrolase [Gammaproteobacteria bacterium]
MCPGGGYRVLASTHEGLHVAAALNRAGIAAFVLRYRVGPKYHSSVSLLDGQRAMRYVRHHAARFDVDPHRLGMLGFSAGGHLTLAVGTGGESKHSDAQDPVDRQSSRPDFLVPVYAVSNGIVRGRKATEYTPTDTAVSAETPPTFLVHTHEDDIVPANQATLFYDALRAARVPAELHIFGYGEHGVGLASGDPDTHQWFPLLVAWLRRTGFLTAKQRVAIDQPLPLADDIEHPLGMYWVTLIPDDPHAPIARIRQDPRAGKRLTIPAMQGPVSGPHTLQLRRVSHTWEFSATSDYEPIDKVEPMLSENPTISVRVNVDTNGEISLVEAS